MKTLYWLVKREFWEHRGSFLIAPIVAGGIFVLMNLMGIVTAEVFGMRHGINVFSLGGQNNLDLMLHTMDTKSMAEIGSGLDLVMLSASGLICIVLAIVLFFYCLNTLYEDRRDRSILFWKSLPISNTMTVVSKVLAATILAPVIAVICGVLAGIAMLLIFAITLSLHGASVWSLLMQAHPFQVIGTLIGSLPIYLLWALPTVGWLMLCSAWSRNKPFLWAVMLPVGVGIMLSWFNLLGSAGLGTEWYWRNIFVRLLFSVFPGWLGQAATTADNQVNVDAGQIAGYFGLANSYSVLATPGIWIGAAIGLAMLAAAVWFRRWRDDS